jgi:hypothetical protein
MIIRSHSVPTVAAALLLAIAMAGCGGTASSSSVDSQSGTGTQRTTPPPVSHSTGGSSTSSSDGIVVSAGKKIGAAAYLKSITPVRLQLLRVHRSTSAMAAAIKAGDAPTAGRNAMAAATGVRRALAIARRIRPHQEPWATIHTQLMANLQIGVAYLTEMGGDLSAVDIPAIHRWNKTVMPEIRKSERWYGEWAGNVAVFAGLDNVKPPHWLHTMDRWN